INGMDMFILASENHELKGEIEDKKKEMIILQKQLKDAEDEIDNNKMLPTFGVEIVLEKEEKIKGLFKRSLHAPDFVMSRSLVAKHPVKSPDYKGTEFILAFMENYHVDASLELYLTTSVYHDVKVDVSSPKYPSTSLPLSITLQPGVMKRVQFDSSFAMSGTRHDSKAILVRSEDEIIAYGSNKSPASTDAFLSLPTDILSNEYYVATYDYNGAFPNEVLIIGNQNFTIVEITLSDAIGSGSVMWQGVAYNRGETFQLYLDRFDTIQIQSQGDMTGSYLKSNNPIGVMSGVKCANIGPGACDHIVEMMMPVSTWGKTFATVPIPNRTVGDVFRLISSEDSTTITISGGYNYASSITKAGDFVELIIPSTSYCYIQANKALMVVQYVRGQSGTDLGDPSMLLVQPLGGYSSSFSFTTLTKSTGSFQNYFAFLVRKKFKDGLRLDGNQVITEFHEIAGSDYVGGYISITEGAHSIRHVSPIALFAGYLYGKGHYESYAFPIGSRLAPINLACNPSKTVVGDGLDNDCDNLIDEEICTAANNGLDVNECDPNPCQNNATCNGTVGAFECLCQEFYSGFLCQKDLCEVKKTDIIFLVDTSLSTGSDELDKQVNFMKNLLNKITISYEKFEVAVIKYSDVPVVDIHFNSSLSKNEILRKFETIQLMNSSTNVGAALKTAHEMLSLRTSIRQFVYLFTDGLVSNIVDAEHEALYLQNYLKKTGIGNSLSVISFGKSVRHKTLTDIANAAKLDISAIFTWTNMDAFYNLLPHMVDPACKACYETTSSDIVFLIQSNGNMTNEVFQRQINVLQQIMKRIGEKYEIGPRDLQFGGIIFSYHIHFSLNLNTTHKPIRITQYLSSVLQDNVVLEVNVSSAVNYLQEVLLTEGKGKRNASRTFVIYFVSHNVDQYVFIPLKQSGFTVIAIGIDTQLPDDAVTDIASTASHAFFVDSDFNDETVDLLIKEFRYTLCTERMNSSI
ncbi:hypothetical protein FSP39_015521, partial [Pinctada imbricata]